MKRPLLDASLDDLRAWMTGRGWPGFHAQQVWRWVLRRGAESIGVMTDLSQEQREALEAEWMIFGTSQAHHSQSPDGTDKLLLACGDGRQVECVLMYEQERRTACI